MVDKLDLDRLRALVEAASPLPWVYRPEKYDDWGWIRGVERDDRGIGPFRPIVANAKDSLVSDEDMDAHRRAGTDPYSPNAELIVTAVNLIPTLLANAATPANGEQVERAALGQNDAMRQELAHIGNFVSDLARAMKVDQANDDGSWPDLAGRIRRLIDATPTEDARVKVLEEALRPFVDLRAQRGAWGVISNALDGLAPLTVTVTKSQMLAACSALGNKEADRHG